SVLLREAGRRLVRRSDLAPVPSACSIRPARVTHSALATPERASDRLPIRHRTDHCGVAAGAGGPFLVLPGKSREVPARPSVWLRPGNRAAEPLRETWRPQ